MSSIKCNQCGLVNYAYLENCKRCRTALGQGQLHAGAARQPVGAWRDRWWLVKKLGVPLNDTCIKCSESADVSYQPVRLKTYSAWSLLTQLAGIRIFRMIDVEVPLCRRHQFGMDKLVVGMIIAGVLIGLLGLAGMQMNSILPLVVIMAGFFVVAAAIVLYLIRKDAVKVWRYKEPYIWLWGVHRSYLERLPEWSERRG